MKKSLPILIITTILLTFQSCAIITTESNPVTKIVTVENAKQNELFVRANNWMVGAFNNAESVIQFTDKESGTITGKYLLGTVTTASKYGPARRVFALIKIQVKDNASKITITPDSFSYAKGNPYTLYTNEKAETDINNLIKSFEKSIVQKEDDNW
ncbi:DUF4468 domain-containing protein [Yeosuana sp.]|uniref:DUF4468 domain-containing protein n=1 Tax=Yeosuana sp. TaxID=2529388 RepID=UPI004054E91E